MYSSTPIKLVSISLLLSLQFTTCPLYLSPNNAIAAGATTKQEVTKQENTALQNFLFDWENPTEIEWQEEPDFDSLIKIEKTISSTGGLQQATLNAKKLSTQLKVRKSTSQKVSASKTKDSSDFQTNSSIPPLFATPAMPPAWLAGDFVARNQELVSQMNFTEDADKQRMNSISQSTALFAQNFKKLPEGLQEGLNLIKLLEEHSIYLENLRGLGVKDSRFADLNGAIRVARLELAKHALVMQKTFASTELKAQWKALELVSRLKAGDTKAQTESTEFTVNQRNTLGDKVMLTGLAWDAMAGKSKSSFGSLENGIEIAQDDATKAALTMFLGEQTAIANPSAALKYFEDAAKLAAQLKRPDGSSGPIAVRASLKLIASALKANSRGVNPDTVTALQNAGAPELARFYLERVALTVAPKDIPGAIRAYSNIQSIGETPPVIIQKIELRKLDLAASTKNTQIIEQQWQSYISREGFQKNTVVNQKAMQTLSTMLATYEAGKKPADLQRLIRVNDLFTTKLFGNNDSWNLKILGILSTNKSYSLLSQRADDLFSTTSSNTTKQTALQYALIAKEQILGFSKIPEMKAGKKIVQSATLEGYLKNLQSQRDASFSSSKDKSIAKYQLFYLSFLQKGADAARTEYDAAIQGENVENLKGKAFLLMVEFYEKQGRFADAETITRSAISANTVLEKGQNIKSILERNVFSSATALAAQGKSEEAGDKFVKFRQEFPSSAQAEKSIENAVKQFRLSTNDNKLLSALKLHLSLFANSKLNREFMWESAELCAKLDKKLDAATFYEAYGTKYPQDAATRRPWNKAAVLQMALKKYAFAVADHEKDYLALGNGKSNLGERAKAAKEIANIQRQFGRPTDAIGALERYGKMATNPDEILWTLSEKCELYFSSGNFDGAKEQALKSLKVNPGSDEGEKSKAKARYFLSKIEAEPLKKTDFMSEANVMKAIADTEKNYMRTKANATAGCPALNAKTCAMGSFEIARIAEEIAKNVLEFQIPATLDPKEVEPLKAKLSQNSAFYTEETRTLALQADSVLNTSGLDTESAERIRAFAKPYKK